MSELFGYQFTLQKSIPKPLLALVTRQNYFLRMTEDTEILPPFKLCKAC